MTVAGSASVTFDVASVVSAPRVLWESSSRARFRRSLPDSVFGKVPGGNNRTSRGACPTWRFTRAVMSRLIRRRTSSVVGVKHFGEHREALSLGVDAQRDHTALAHSVDVLGRTLDIVRIQVVPGQHDEILRAATHVDPPLLVEVTQVAGVEPAVHGGRVERRRPS